MRRFPQLSSLHGRVRAAQTVLLALMLIPAIVSISLMMVFSSRYHAVILHMEKVSLLRPLVQDDLMDVMSDIVVGRTKFQEGNQYALLQDAAGRLDVLIEEASGSRMELTVAQRTLGTVQRNIDLLGTQMQNGSTVDADMRQMEEIRNVAALFLEMLQDAIHADIRAAGVGSRQMQTVLRNTLGIEIALLAVSLTFAIVSEQWLSRSIRGPIDRLKRLAGRIAAGELKERADPPDVDELKELTQSLNTMAEKLEHLIQENTREQENLKKSELRALQAQITPHFLYNTLDAIVWLAESKRTAEVVQITGALSSFFRISLSGGKDWITLRQEKEHLLGYLTILRVRYRDILKYEIDIDERLEDCQILKLLIQPLVENALYHGIKNKRGGGLVRVSIQAEGDLLRVEVRDNGAGMDAQRLGQVRQSLHTPTPAAPDSGYGLSSVDQRIKLYYNQPEGVSLDSAPGEGTTVRFAVPVRVTAQPGRSPG
jgi:two-component system sensor histidine kinase YesM